MCAELLLLFSFLTRENRNFLSLLILKPWKAMEIECVKRFHIHLEHQEEISKSGVI